MSDSGAGGGERDVSGVGGRLKRAARNVLGTTETSEVLITVKAEMQGVKETVAGLTKEFEGLSTALENIRRNSEAAQTGMQKFREAMPRFTEAMRIAGIGIGGAQAYAGRYAPGGTLGQGFSSMEQALTPFMVAGRGVNGGQFTGLENQMNQMGRMGYGSFGTQDMSQAMSLVNQRMGLGGMSTMFGEQGAAAITARLTGSSLAEGAQGSVGMYGAQTINSLARFGVTVQPGGQRRPFQEIALEAIKAAAPRKAVTKETLELAHPGTSFYESLSYVLGGDQTLVDQVLAVGRANWSLKGNIDRPAGFSDRQIDELMGGTTTSMARDFGQAEGRRQAEEYGAGGRENVRAAYSIERVMEDFKTDLAGMTQSFGPVIMGAGMVTAAFGGVVQSAGALAGHLMAMRAMTAAAGQATPGGVNPGMSGMTMGKGGLAAMIGAIALPMVGNAIAPLVTDDPNKQMLIKKGTSMAGGALGGAQLGFMVGGPWGAAAGGLIGGAVGLLSGGFGGGDPVPASIGSSVSGAHQQQNASASSALMAQGTGVNAQQAKTFLQTVNTSSYGASAINGLQPGFAIQLYKLIKKYPRLGCGSGFRSEEQQRKLYTDRRCDIPGNCCKGGPPACAHTATAKPGSSWHEAGVAMDLTPHPNPGLSDAQFAEFGLYRPMSYEPWHVQPTHVKSGGRGKFDAEEQAAMLALSGGTLDVGSGPGGLGGALGSGGSAGGGTFFNSGRAEDAAGGAMGGGGGGGAGGLSYNEVSATLGAVGSAAASGSIMSSVNNGGGGALAPGGDPGTGGAGGVVGPPGVDYGKQLSGATAAKYARAAGFTGSDLVTAVAVMNAESHFKADAHNGNAGTGDNSYGLFQINMLDRTGNMMGEARRKQYGLASNDQLFDPTTNAKIAYDFYKSMGFQPWSTYKRGEHSQWMDEARTYVQQAGVGDAIPSSIAGPISHNHTWNVNIGQASIAEMENMITEMESRAMNRTGQRPETRR